MVKKHYCSNNEGTLVFYFLLVFISFPSQFRLIVQFLGKKFLPFVEHHFVEAVILPSCKSGKDSNP